MVFLEEGEKERTELSMGEEKEGEKEREREEEMAAVGEEEEGEEELSKMAAATEVLYCSLA